MSRVLSPADLITGKLLIQLGDASFEDVRRHTLELDADPHEPWDLVSSLVSAGLLSPEQVKRIRHYVAIFWRVRQAGVALRQVERRLGLSPSLTGELMARIERANYRERLGDLLAEAGVMSAAEGEALEREVREALEVENARLVERYRAEGFAPLARPLIPGPVVDEETLRISVLVPRDDVRERVDALLADLKAAAPTAPPAPSLSASWDGTWEEEVAAARARLAQEPPQTETTRMAPHEVLSPPAPKTDTVRTERVLRPPNDPRRTTRRQAAFDPTRTRSDELDREPGGGQLTRIGPYEVLQLIGRGSMGSVFLCAAPNGGMVAVKTLPASGADPEDARRFEREVAVVSRLRHPNTVGLVGRGETEDGVKYMVMPPYVGHSLREVLREQGPLPVELVLHYMEEILVGLSAIHAAGVVHRDLKPDNVLVLAGQDERRIKIVDFGIARPIDHESLQGDARFRTAAGIFTGSPAYVAPETIVGDPFDGRTDLYSLGVLLFELLTGGFPFSAESLSELLSLHLAGAPLGLADVAADVPWPRELEGLIADLLERELEARPASADAVLEALRSGLSARILEQLQA